MPKVSIIMPSLNVGSFIRECIESAVNQTLKEIEIICVDAGSTDGTLEVLQEYAEKDSRVHLIHSDVKSYGYQMNLGLDAATGEYIGILETDDWAEPNMFETLWHTAKEHNADFVKSNFYRYSTKNGIHNHPHESLVHCTYDRVFPAAEEKHLFLAAPSIWSGIYLREMLMTHHIRFNETPGASFQDTSFHFMVCSVSQRCYLLRDCFLHYRVDNDGSSVHSKSKVYYIADEMRYYEAFLDKYPAQKEKLLPLFQMAKLTKYRWNLERLTPVDYYSFLKLMQREFSDAFAAGLMDERYFPSWAWLDVQQIVSDPAAYFRKNLAMQEDALRSIEPELCKAANCADPQISVIIPFYNAAPYLKECLQSVVCQSFRDIEIICVDDGSTDASRKIVEEYAAADSRFAILDLLVNKGPSAARNAGTRISRGKYIYFIDTDGYILPDALEQLYACAETRQLDILYFGAKRFFENGKYERSVCYQENSACQEPVSGDIFLSEKLQKHHFCCNVSLQLIRRGFLEETQLDLQERKSCIADLFPYILAAKAKRVFCIEDALYVQRASAESSAAELPTPDKCANQFIAAMSLGSIAIEDQSLSHTAKQVLSLRSADLLKDARTTYRQLSATPRKRIIKILPVEYRAFFTELVLENWMEQKRLAELKRSRSYKIGAAITFVPRKVRGFIRHIKKNGLRGAIRHVFMKVKR